MTLKENFIKVLTRNHTLIEKSKLTGRNMTFDFIRGLAVVFMVLIHVAGTYGNSMVEDSFFYEFVDFLGSPPAAPVFMLTMGIFFTLSSSTNDLLSNIKRGVKLLILGFALSFVRSDLLYFFTGDIQNLNFLTNENLITFWEIDILQFAGLAYIFMALIKHYFKKPMWWLIIALVIVVVSPILWGIDSDNTLVSHLFNSLFGASDVVFFPIFPWLYYPLIGMIMGLMIRVSGDVNELLNSLIKPGILILTIGSIISLTNLEFHIGDYYRSGPGSVVWITGFLLIWIGLNNMLINKVKENTFFNIIYRWGKDTTPIYLVHWFIISWGTLIFGSEAYGYTGTIALMIVFLISSNYLSKLLRIKL